jgi:expansin
MRASAGVLVVVALSAACSRAGNARVDQARAPTCDLREPIHHGEATHYDADGSGNCSFAPVQGEVLVAALGAPHYDRSAACGACAKVDGPSGSVTVRIVDRCPGCGPGHLDLSREAFARIAALERGRVPISWRYVPCEVSGPVRYRFKDGSNPWWTGIQVRNHRHRIARFEARTSGEDDDAFVQVHRRMYNYFVTSKGLGRGPFDFRITDVHGNVLQDEGIPLGDDTEVAGAEQLPVCR